MPRTLPGTSTGSFEQMFFRASKWYALYTATHHEKHVSEHLTSRGVESFCPLYKTCRQWKKSKGVVLELPLFPNYLFIRISREQRGAVLSAPGVFSIVGSSREAWELPDREVEALRSGFEHRSVQPHSYLSVGERARVVSGPLTGLEGLIVRDKQNCRIVLTLDQIMRSVSIEVGAHELEPMSVMVRQVDHRC
jgi:transcription antitermination factor NusG